MTEGLNTSSESDSDDTKESDGKTKKRAEAIGGTAVFEPRAKAEREVASDKPGGIAEFLGLGKKTEKDQAQAESDEGQSQEQATESAEALSELSPEETQAAIREIATSHQADAEQATDEPLNDEAIAAEAAVERFHDKIIAEDKDADLAFAETLQEIDAAKAEAADEVEPEEEAPQELTDEVVELNPHNPAEADPDDPVIATTQASGTPPPGNRNPPPTAAASGSPPPPRATPVYGSAAPAAPGSASSTRTEYITVRDRRGELSAALLGGIVGYLIGRRRGRIKTERRLLPIQQKLERQVEQLHQDIVNKEQTIRQAAVERIRAERQPLSRSVAPEATRLHSPQPVEKIGAVLVTAQAETTPTIERTQIESIDRHVETLSRVDLLELSSKITVEGTTLRQAYETNLIGERALRRIVAEHLRGGDVSRALSREIVEHQIDYERDPVLRDRLQRSAASPTVDNLLEQANLDATTEQRQELAVLRARASTQAKQQFRHQRRRHTVDAVMITTIAVLFILVIMLAISRG